MATRQQWLSTTRLRNELNTYGHAMPFGLVKVYTSGRKPGILTAGPICVFAQGRRVPISRGSPPDSG